MREGEDKVTELGIEGGVMKRSVRRGLNGIRGRREEEHEYENGK
jgi:hypothetical protein